MVERTPEAIKEHDGLVKMMANYFERQGSTQIKADLANYTRPDKINGHIPDLTCYKNGTFIILEAETCDTIYGAHTESQWTSFYNYANRLNGEFHVVVPKTCDNKSGSDMANDRLKELRISAKTVWTPS